MAVIFVTGMSGTGKTTALKQLEQRGYKVVDTDVGKWIEDVPLPDGAGVEPQWREDRIDALITEHEISGEPLFIAGTVWNQGRFYPRFDEIVLFSAPLKIMLERIATRDTNPFGKTVDQRAQIVADTAEVEPLLRSSATVEIDTRKPLVEVVDQLAALVGPPPSEKLHFRYTP
jgi:shikimate kinase